MGKTGSHKFILTEKEEGFSFGQQKTPNLSTMKREKEAPPLTQKNEKGSE